MGGTYNCVQTRETNTDFLCEIVREQKIKVEKNQETKYLKNDAIDKHRVERELQRDGINYSYFACL